jgi:hypothetical protein
MNGTEIPHDKVRPLGRQARAILRKLCRVIVTKALGGRWTIHGEEPQPERVESMLDVLEGDDVTRDDLNEMEREVGRWRRPLSIDRVQVSIDPIDDDSMTFKSEETHAS